ncbi:MAG TPA: MFS transporter [Solirubrobacteraceae bacterium]|nr:MFS transporter [Solirubrobacteraceae bacterium]
MSRLRILLVGDAFAVLGSYFQIVALAALAFQLTHSVAVMSLQFGGAAMFSLVLAPWAGRWVDRLADRRQAMILADVGRALLAVVLARSGLAWELIALAALSAVGNVVFFTARGALLVELAGRDGIGRWNGVRSVTAGAARLAGPFLAGVVAARWGVADAFFLNGATYLISASATALVPAVRVVARAPAAAGPGVLADPGLREVLGLQGFTQLGQWMVNTAWLVWAQAAAFGGTALMGTGMALFEGGSLVAGAILLRAGGRPRVAWLRAAALGEAATWCLYLVCHSAAMLLALSVAEGICSWAVATFALTLVQQRAPDDRQGAALAVSNQVDGVGRLAGTLVAGPLPIPGVFALAAAVTAAGASLRPVFGRGPASGASPRPRSLSRWRPSARWPAARPPRRPAGR